MHRSLESMAHLMEEGEFDKVLLEKIDSCLTTHNLTLMQDAEWSGYLQSGQSQPWGKERGQGYKEYDVAEGDDGVVVFERCNFASNAAFFYSLV